MRYIIIAILLLSIFVSCNRGQKYSKIPDIKFISLSSDSIKRLTNDSILIYCSYMDDGDIGISENAGNVTLQDSRDTIKYKYGFPKINAEYISSKGVKGNFLITFLGAGINVKDTNNSRETFHWDIQVTDKAGNKSNIVSTSDFTVLK